MAAAVRLLSGLLAAVLVLAALLGPLGFEVVTFHVSESARTQYLGGEFATLTVAVFLAWHAIRPESVTRVAVPGMCLYLIYTFATVVMGQNYSEHPNANAQKYFGLYTPITTCAAVLFVLSCYRAKIKLPAPRVITATRLLFGMIAVLFSALWIMQIVDFHSGADTASHDADPALFWLIKFLDFSFFIPALIIVAVLLPNPSVKLYAQSLVAFVACLAVAVTGMSIAQALAGEPGVAFVAVFMATLSTLVITVLIFWLRAQGVEKLCE